MRKKAVRRIPDGFSDEKMIFMKLGLVLEGGANRGGFTAVRRAFLEESCHFFLRFL